MSRLRWAVEAYRAPLARPLATGAGTFTERAGWFVTCADEEGHGGLGEASPLPAWGSESPEACARALEGLIAAGTALPTFEALPEALAAVGLSVKRTPAAWAAAELALLDMLARRAGVPVAALLGGVRRERVPVNALVAAKAPESAAGEAREAIARGFPVVKLKVGALSLAEDVARVMAVRAAIGDRPLRLDANAAWGREAAIAALTAFRPASPDYVEQPVPPEDVEGLVVVARESGVNVAADEAVQSPEDARALLAAGVRVLVLKPMAQGGLLAAKAIAEEAQARGARVVLTSALDRGVGTAGVLHLAAVLPEIEPAGLATAGLFVDGPAVAGLVPEDGALAVPSCPGLIASVPPSRGDRPRRGRGGEEAAAAGRAAAPPSTPPSALKRRSPREGGQK